MLLSDKRRTETQYKYIAVVASISTAIVLTFIKAIAAFITGSLSILSSAADSLSDVLSSAITFIAVIYSGKPLTCNHRYGYGRIEAVSALIQAAFISGSACFILYDSVYRFFHPVELEHTFIGMCVMIISLLLTFLLICFQKHVMHFIKSQAVEADNYHYIIDLTANSAVLISLMMVHWLNWTWFDIITAVLVSCYLIFTAFKISAKALAEITDKEVDDEIKAKIINEILKINGVMGYHDMRSRISGSRLFFEIHLELSGQSTLYETHKISDAAERKIMQMYPNAQVIIHQDPFGIQEDRIDNNIEGPCLL